MKLFWIILCLPLINGVSVCKSEVGKQVTSKRDAETSTTPAEPSADKGVTEGFIDEAAILEAVWGSDDEEDELSEAEKNEELPKAMSRAKRAFIKMPTDRRYRIPSPIEHVSNICVWKQYINQQRLVKREAGYLNQRMLFHGTTAVDDIIASGFNEQYSTYAHNMFGAGIYFAKHSSKANQYVFGSSQATGCPTHKDLNCKICERKLLLCRVTLGRVKTETAAVTYANEPKGYNSVAGVPSPGGLKYPEFAIYKREQAYPQFVITYTVE